jgi:excisionase family DNA binding protein
MSERNAISPDQLQTAVQLAEHYVDADEAASFLSISRRTLMRMARKDVVPAHPLGNGTRRLWRFLLSELDCWMRNQVNSHCRPCSPKRREIQ